MVEPGGTDPTPNPAGESQPHPDQQPDEPSGPPTWLVPAAAGLLGGLVIAIGIFALTRGGDDDDTMADQVAATSAPSTAPVETTEAPVETTAPPVETTAPPVETTAPPVETTAPPVETTAPPVETTEPPATTAAPADEIPIASDGFVRVLDNEYPIVRQCSASPIVAFSALSYVYDTGGGNIEFVELLSDEGAPPFGSWNGETYEIEMFGDDGFGMLAAEGDSEVPVSANPADTTPFQCVGFVTETDPTNPDFPANRGVLDICFGDVARIDDDGTRRIALGYRGLTTEGGVFEALPNADGSLLLDYRAPGIQFAGIDPVAAADDFIGAIEISGTAVGDPGGEFDGLSREIVINVDESLVRTCAEIPEG